MSRKQSCRVGKSKQGSDRRIKKFKRTVLSKGCSWHVIVSVCKRRIIFRQGVVKTARSGKIIVYFNDYIFDMKGYSSYLLFILLTQVCQEFDLRRKILRSIFKVFSGEMLNILCEVDYCTMLYQSVQHVVQCYTTVYSSDILLEYSVFQPVNSLQSCSDLLSQKKNLIALSPTIASLFFQLYYMFLQYNIQYCI